jgi:hypothetical protein
MVGITLTKQSIDATSGSVAVAVDTALTRVRQFKYFLDGTVDADLVALGYTAAEVATLRSAYTDLDQLATVYQGGALLAVAKDFRVFARRLMGMGAL